MRGDFRVVVTLEAVGDVATATMRRHEERFPLTDPNAYKNAYDTYESLLTALGTLEAFGE